MKRPLFLRPIAFAALVGSSVPAFAKEAAPPAAKESAPAAAPTPPPAVPAEPVDRVIEKRVDNYVARLLVRPGNLKPGRTAEVSVDLQKILDLPDPVNGDRAPLNSSRTRVVVHAPESAKGKSSAPVRYQLWPTASGMIGFHFTPSQDGVYRLTFEGVDATLSSTDPRPFAVSFQLGAGTAVAQTEMGTGVGGGRRSSRRPVGGDGDGGGIAKLQRSMEDVGYRWLSLGEALQRWPAKGVNGAAASEARALGALFESIKELAPEGPKNGADEFSKLAMAASATMGDIAKAAEADGKDRAARIATAKATYEKFEMQTCMQCHAKFRWGVTTDLTQWPNFSQNLRKN